MDPSLGTRVDSDPLRALGDMLDGTVSSEYIYHLPEASRSQQARLVATMGLCSTVSTFCRPTTTTSI
jgi:hypothetical protein